MELGPFLDLHSYYQLVSKMKYMSLSKSLNSSWPVGKDESSGQLACRKRPGLGSCYPTEAGQEQKIQEQSPRERESHSQVLELFAQSHHETSECDLITILETVAIKRTTPHFVK